MARLLTTRRIINFFIVKVIQDANHHAGNVEYIIQPLANAILNRMNFPTDTLEVWDRNGNIGRTCWVTINGNRYALSYDYNKQVINLRHRSIQGNIIFSFDNNTSPQVIRRIVGGL